MDVKKVEALMDDRNLYKELIVCTAQDIANTVHILSAGSLGELVTSLRRYSEELANIEAELQKITGLLPCNFSQLSEKCGADDENT